MCCELISSQAVAAVQEAAKFTRHARRSQTQSADINHALQLRDVAQMHGFGASDRRRYAAVSGAPHLHYVQDRVHSCEELVYRPLPAPPVESGPIMHWLLVEGVKPRIPENAVPRQLLEATRSKVRKRILYSN